jgi:hypothetical protein
MISVVAGAVTETYAAALQHDLVELDGATPVGVVRRPPGWFHALVAENRRELGPPDPLLDEAKEKQDALQMAGMCDTGAHNAAFEATDFAVRYRRYLEDESDARAAIAESNARAAIAESNARAAIDSLRSRVRDGEDVALVCFEADDRTCHRHTLQEVLRDEV